MNIQVGNIIFVTSKAMINLHGEVGRVRICDSRRPYPIEVSFISGEFGIFIENELRLATRNEQLLYKLQGGS